MNIRWVQLMSGLVVSVGACVQGGAAHADVRVQAVAASEYVYRGINQTDGAASYQGLIEYSSNSGFYLGAWAGRVDAPGDNRDWEVDYFVGYQRRLQPQLALDVTLVRYTYDGERYGIDQDWTELQLTAHLFDRWSVLVAAADNWWGRDERTYVAEVVYRYPLPGGLVADLTAGYQHAERAIDDNYRYGEVGLARAFGPLSARLAYTNSGGVDTLDSLASSRWVASFSWQLTHRHR